MRNYFVLVVAALVLFVGDVWSQSRTWRALDFTYSNGLNSRSTTAKDSVANTTPDTLDIALPRYGNRAPLGVQVAVKLTDADISGTPDSVLVRYEAGVGGYSTGIYVPIVSATTYDSVITLSSAYDGNDGNPFIRTWVFTVDGDVSAELNSQVGISPYMEVLRVIFGYASTANSDTVSYQVKAAAVYQE